MSVNLGENYVDNYNMYITEIIENAVKTFKDNYNTNKSFNKVKELVLEPLVEESKSLYKKTGHGNLFQEVTDWFPNFCKNYTYDKTISVINEELKTKIFDKTEERGDILDYSEFVDLLYRREAIRYFHNFVKDNSELLEKAFNKKKIDKSFTLLSKNREVKTLVNLSNKSKLEKSKVAEIIQLDKNEKLILLNIFINENKFEIPPTEKFRLLILCSDIFDENNFFNINTNNTDYEYFRQGINKAGKNLIKKREILQDIISQLERIETLNIIVKSVKLYRARLK